MLLKKIPITETSFIPPIVKDYLTGNEFLKQFYGHEPELNSFADVIAKRNFDNSKRALLVEVIKEQYKEVHIDTDDLVNTQINKLNDVNTFTVTTGHQLCLFTGPLYFIYKILTTIKLAADLKEKYPDYHFVPVFWLASEDHDFEEINHIHLFNKTITWEIDTDNKPVGKITTASMTGFINEIRQLFSNKPEHNELLELFEDAYTASENLSVATRKIAHGLFKKYGLISIEPDNRKLKNELKSIMLDDIFNQKSYQAINKTNKLIEEQYKLQINGREINFFYLSDKGRHLIRKQGEYFVISNTDLQFTEEELKKEIADYSERFSPNVLLRPVYQELILPNIAYIGGPAEIAYWLQLAEVFEAYQVKFPVLWLRNSIMLLNSSLIRMMEKLKINADDFLSNETYLVKKILNREQAFNFEERAKAIEDGFQNLIDKLSPLDNKLVSRAIKHKNENSVFLNKLKKEINEKIKEKAEQDISKTLKIKETLFPSGTPQERYDNIMQFSGGLNFIDLIYNNIETDFSLKLLGV